MKKIVCENYSELCIAAADLFEAQLAKKPTSVFGLATGSTPIGLYEELSKRVNDGKMDFSNAKAFNLDEYYPINPTHPQSYKYFMDENLFNKVNFASTNIPNGETTNPSAECAEYDSAIKTAGGIDLQLLGIGVNGHIGFNEPDTTYSINTNLTKLTESTLEANSRFFDDPNEQPRTALTMGFGSIFAAKHILLLISGGNKAEVARKLFEGKIHTDVPASFLLLHPNVTLIIDKDANGN